MTSESLTKTLSLLIKLEWGVDIFNVDAPFISTTNRKGLPITIACSVVSHRSGVMPKQTFDTNPDFLLIYIDNKLGNNLVMLSNKTTKKLISRDVSMREIANGIIYKNQIEG